MGLFLTLQVWILPRSWKIGPDLDRLQGEQIWSTVKDGEPWFVAADVCRALGLEQVTRAMDRLDDDERGLVKVTHPYCRCPIPFGREV